MADHTLALTDPAITPTEELIADCLGDTYGLWTDLTSGLTDGELGLELKWSYYKDSKAWLCKAVRGAKTLAWLSVWEGYSQATVYFSERHREGLAELPLESALRRQIATEAMVGRMLPVPMPLRNHRAVVDALTVIRFKRSAK